MKKIVMLICFMGLAIFARAQDQGNQPPQRPERPSPDQIIKKATKELSLSDDQIAQWEEIFAKYESSMQQNRDAAQDTRKEMGTELEETLNEEQLVKFKEMRENRERPPMPIRR